MCLECATVEDDGDVYMDRTVELTSVFDQERFDSSSVEITIYVRLELYTEEGLIEKSDLAIDFENKESSLQVIYSEMKNWDMEEVKHRKVASLFVESLFNVIETIKRHEL